VPLTAFNDVRALTRGRRGTRRQDGDIVRSVTARFVGSGNSHAGRAPWWHFNLLLCRTPRQVKDGITRDGAVAEQLSRRCSAVPHNNDQADADGAYRENAL